MKRFLLPLLLLLFACGGGGVKSFEQDKATLAVVGSYAISRSDFLESLIEERVGEEADDSLKSRVWDRLLDEVLVLNDAMEGEKPARIVPLAEAGDAQERRELVDLILQQKVYSKTQVSETEVHQYYRDHPEEFRKGSGYLLRQIVVPTLKQAEEVLVLLKGRHAFEQVARLYSISPDRGAPQYFEDGEIPDYLQPVLRAIAPTTPSSPLAVAPDTYQVVWVEKRLGAYTLPIEDKEVAVRIRLQLTDELGRELYREYLLTLRARYGIHVFENKLSFRYQKEST